MTLYPSLAFSKGDQDLNKLYLAISSDAGVWDEVSERRYQRMLLKKIIELGKHEFQIFDKTELKNLAITGKVLKIKFKSGPIDQQLELHYSIQTFKEGEKLDKKSSVINLARNQIFSDGIEKVVSVLERE